MDQRHEPVVVETERYRIEGKLTLPREGYRSRLSDFVNQRDREFFAMEDVSVTRLDGGSEASRVPFLLVARSHIRLIVPGDGATA